MFLTGLAGIISKFTGLAGFYYFAIVFLKLVQGYR